MSYDLLVSNIGGIYDLANQLQSNREFGHLLVVSQSQVPQSQVPREFGVNCKPSITDAYIHHSALMGL